MIKGVGTPLVEGRRIEGQESDSEDAAMNAD